MLNGYHIWIITHDSNTRGKVIKLIKNTQTENTRTAKRRQEEKKKEKRDIYIEDANTKRH